MAGRSRDARASTVRFAARPALRVAVIALVLAGVLAAVGSNQYYVGVLSTAGIAYIVISSLNLLMGYVGVFSLGQAAFLGVGAYAAAYMTVKLGLDALAGLAVAIVAGAAVAAVIAIPFSRLRGHFLAMATLAFGGIFTELAVQLEPITGGANGILGKPLTAFGHQLGERELLGLIFAGDVLVFVVLLLMLRGWRGLAFAAVKRDELMAETQGVNTAAQKLLAFAISGAMCGLAGFFFFYYAGFIDPTSFGIIGSINYLSALVIGGQGYAAGPILGAATFYGINTALASFPTERALLFGAALVIVVSVSPSGLSGLIERGWRRLRSRDELRGDVALGPAAQAGSSLHLLRRRADLRDEAAGPIVSVSGVAKSYGGLRVLEDVSFDVPAETNIMSIIGPNGAGKTTLLNILTGVTPLTSGAVDVLGLDVTRLSSRRIAAAGVARTFQVPRLMVDKTVLENVELGMYAGSIHGEADHHRRREDRGRAAARAREILNHVALGHVADRRVATLPHGPRRVVEIARALASGPRLLILDEPAAGLDEFELEWLNELLRSLSHEYELSVILVDHRMDLVMRLSDEIVVLHHGRVLARGNADEIRQNAEVADAYLGRVEV
jgi:ABC-type branched-subunit amino acid transport system ATPase component/ABC-type branched-subunit amino acid transport system permease subunit